MKKLIAIILIMPAALFAANEIKYIDVGGKTNLSVRITKVSNLYIYDTVAAELSASPTWANTVIAVTQADPNFYAGLYRADMPAVAAGMYYFQIFQSASPAKTDTPLWTWIAYWDGNAFQNPSEQIVAVVADVNSLNTVVAREIEDYGVAKEQTVIDSNEVLKANLDTLITGVNVATIDGEVPVTKSEYAAEVVAAMDANSVSLAAIIQAISDSNDTLYALVQDSNEAVIAAINSSDVSESVAFLRDVAEADSKLITTGTPWLLRVLQKNSGETLIEKELYDWQGREVVNINTVIAEHRELDGD